ncbi:MAG TPA: hypothetical protein VGC41_14490, partial [Kofleriaceae bacterium]
PEWLARVTTKQATFHRSIVAADAQAKSLRAEMRSGIPHVAKWTLGTALVFGVLGKACSSLDSEQINITYAHSQGPPRVMASYWTPDVAVPIDQLVTFVHLPYQVALHHHETLVLWSPDEGGDKESRLTVKNTSTFPFATKEWTRPWAVVKAGREATFTAPYTGLFVVKLDTFQPEEGKTHLRWSVR